MIFSNIKKMDSFRASNVVPRLKVSGRQWWKLCFKELALVC